jgi:hypothetical protein
MVRPIVLLVTLLPAVTLASSDLIPFVYGVHFETNASVDPAEVTEGCAGGPVGRTLLRFGTRVTNLGPDDLVIGDPGCPDCTNPANEGASCRDTRFVCDAALGVPHFESAATFELLDPSGNPVVVGSKRGYCFNDDECTAGTSAQFTNCSEQGLTVGCTDDYEPFIYCQYLDVTDVPNATTRAFTLRVTIDTHDLLPDPDRANDVTEVAVPGCGDGIVQPGEECDAGPQGGACCDSACHRVPAGTACRPAAGPCDVAAVCDGASDVCPPNQAAPDGTTCGGGVPPCLGRVCSAGACASRRDESQGCLIDGACFAPGTVDPQDACRRCDVGASPDAWSPDRDADPAGVRCEIGYVTAAAQGIGCPTRTSASLAHRLRRADRLAARLAHARPQATVVLRRRLLRTARSLSRLLVRGRRAGCRSDAVLAELGVLEDQLHAMASAADR